MESSFSEMPRGISEKLLSMVAERAGFEYGGGEEAPD